MTRDEAKITLQLGRVGIMPTDPDKFLELRRIEEANRLRLLEQRDTARVNARIWFCAFVAMSALWVLREVAR